MPKEKRSWKILYFVCNFLFNYKQPKLSGNAACILLCYCKHIGYLFFHINITKHFSKFVPGKLDFKVQSQPANF